MTNADSRQHGGDHYTRMRATPWSVVDTWPLEQRIGFYRGNALKYIMRLNEKDAPADNVGKAAHYCEKLAEVLREADSEPELPLSGLQPGDRFTVNIDGRQYSGVFPTCRATQQSDEMYCATCNLRWDVNDPEPPTCGRMR